MQERGCRDQVLAARDEGQRACEAQAAASEPEDGLARHQMDDVTKRLRSPEHPLIGDQVAPSEMVLPPAPSLSPSVSTTGSIGLTCGGRGDAAASLTGEVHGRPARPAPAHAAVAALANEPHISSRMTGIGRVTTRMDSATGTAVCHCPPDVVTPTGGLVERPANGPAGERFDHRDCLDHRAVGLPAPADVVDLAGSGAPGRPARTPRRGRGRGGCREPA